MPDALSEVLRAIRLRGGVFLDARFSAPWAVSSVLTAEDCKPLLEQPQHLIAYHFMIEGSMLLTVDGEPQSTVRAGEIVLLPRNDMQILASGPGIAPADPRSLIRPSPDGGLFQIDHGGGGVPARMFCGFLGCDEGHNPLLASLPRVLTVDVREAASRDLIEASLKFAAAEIMEGRIAASDVLSRLSEMLLIEAIRRYAESLGEFRSGWLKGLKDRSVGHALSLIHRDITAAWTIEALAKEVALSRSAFIDRFTSFVGVPPIRYVIGWRIEIAKSRLRETTRPIAAIAHSVGYESEEAFSRAFKRETGLSPSKWRETHVEA